MNEALRAVAHLFIWLIERRMRLLLLVFVPFIALLLYSDGLTWSSGLLTAFILLMLGVFWFVSWFWLRFFRSMLENTEERP
jgi:uncharacterized membrane protein YobD (UPF0266 family)